MSVKQISVFLENKPGCLLAMTKVLAEHEIDMRAFSLAETSDFGIARILVDDVIATATVLKDAGFISSVTSVLAVAVPDVPGGLNQVLTVLAEQNINVEYMYAFVGKGTGAYMVFRVTDNSRATGALVGKGIRLVSQEELAEL
ncbi:MAG: ACT domain-containing protein [Clostridia bacterium]|nr:ACT domain-containing protein [Clostridia bacterium]